MTEPEVRTDGLCAQCLRERRKGATKHKLSTLDKSHFRDLADHLAADPFCSTECCRAWYGVVHAGSKSKDRRFEHPGLAA
jgi:hypothetical protein